VGTCGDGIRVGTEPCDDGNTVSGDGCSATCTWETTAEVEPNGTTAQADVALPVITGNANITGAVTPTLDKDIFKVVVAATSVVRFETFDPTGYDCTAALIAAPMKMTLLDSGGVALKTDTSTSGIGNCAELTVLLSAGTYYVQVEKSTSGTIAGYFLQVRFQADDGSEVEPNDTRVTASPMPGRDMHVLGDHTVIADIDWYQLTLPVQASIRAEVIEGDVPTGAAPYNETCESNGIDSTLYLLNSAGTLLTSDGDTGRGYCSQIDGTGASSSNSSAHNLAAGTYYLRVESYDQTTATYNQFKYHLSVVAR
jgi:cysteine-rich repeat protein